MNTQVFIFSGAVSFACTLLLISIVYKVSPSTKEEIHFGKLIGIIFSIYLLINTFYFFKLIPPVPLALNEGIVAHEVTRDGQKFTVSYERDEWYVFWRKHRTKFIQKPGDSAYVFSSVFAPTSLEKTIFHRWKWYNASSETWEHVEDIGYNITGGRDGGYRGYTYKSNLKEGEWRVEVLTEEELVLGVINFELIMSETLKPNRVIKKKF